jgi:hypothetical protein
MPPSIGGLSAALHHITYKNGILLLFFSFSSININADDAPKEDVGSEEVLQCLKLCVVTIQART